MKVPTLLLTDRIDGTGATATIANSEVLADNSVYVLQWRKTSLMGTWALAGGRVGDGTISLSLDKGIYFGHVRSELSAYERELSEIVQGACTDGLAPFIIGVWRPSATSSWASA